VFTSQGYNQIVTVGSGITLNQWTHVVFTRSVATGMHIYVNVKEEKIMVTSGLQNPKGFIKKGTDLYIGHDFGGLMEDLSITNGAAQSVNAVFWILVWLIVAAAVVIAVLAVEIYWSRRGKK
jgi:hypothetical protein